MRHSMNVFKCILIFILVLPIAHLVIDALKDASDFVFTHVSDAVIGMYKHFIRS